MPRQRRPPPPRPPLPRSRLLAFRPTPGSLPTHQNRSRDTRERLIAAVELVVREVGLERATVRAIAARAGVSVGSVYRRFANKRALLLVTQERFLARRTARATRSLRLSQARGRDFDRRLREFVNGELLAIERDRPMLAAFARPAYTDRAIHAQLVLLAEKLGPRSVAARSRAIDLLLTLLRGLVLDVALPSGWATSGSLASGCLDARHELVFLVSDLFGGPLRPRLDASAPRARDGT